MKKTILYPFAAAVFAVLGATNLLAAAEEIAGTVQPEFTISPHYNALGTLFTSSGFEAYTAGTLIGQNGFVRSGGTGDAIWAVGATSGVGGTKGVTITDSTATSFAYPTAAYTPGAGELVSTSIDIAASPVATTNAFGYLLDVYGNTGARIGRVGLVYNAGTIVAAVTGRNGGTAGTNSTYIVSTALTANTFYNFELRFNFTLKTFDVFSGGTAIATGFGFTTLAATGFSDADLQVSGVAGATTVGAFDNYAVAVVPEPSTFALLAVAGLGGVVLRRRRRR